MFGKKTAKKIEELTSRLDDEIRAFEKLSLDKPNSFKMDPMMMMLMNGGEIDPMMLMMMNNGQIDPMMLMMLNQNGREIDPKMLMMMNNGQIDPMMMMMMNQGKNGKTNSSSSMNTVNEINKTLITQLLDVEDIDSATKAHLIMGIVSEGETPEDTRTPIDIFNDALQSVSLEDVQENVGLALSYVIMAMETVDSVDELFNIVDYIDTGDYSDMLLKEYDILKEESYPEDKIIRKLISILLIFISTGIDQELKTLETVEVKDTDDDVVVEEITLKAVKEIVQD